MQDLVIDLGELTRDQSEAVASRTPPRRWRPLLLAVVVLCAVTLTGSLPMAAASPVTVIPARVGDLTFLGPHEYFVVSDTGPAAGSPVQNKFIDVYALPSATLLSRTAVAVTGRIRQVLAVGPTILVSYESDDLGTVATAGYVAGTGHTVWRRYGLLLGVGSSGQVVVLRNLAAGVSTRQWTGVDAQSGDVRWQLDRSTDGENRLVPASNGAPTRLVTVGWSGQVGVYDLDTGRSLATGMATRPQNWNAATGPGIEVTGDLLLASGPQGTTAYGLSDLRERWRTARDLAGWITVPGCGDALCLYDGSSNVLVLDVQTGRQEWTSDGWYSVQRAGSAMLGSGVGEPTDQQPLVVLDAATGRRRGTVGAWQPVGTLRADGLVPVVRPEVGDRRTWYGLLDPAKASVRVLGVAEPVAGTCGATTDVLVCRRVDATAGVWRLTPP